MAPRGNSVVQPALKDAPNGILTIARKILNQTLVIEECSYFIISKQKQAKIDPKNPKTMKEKCLKYAYLE